MIANSQTITPNVANNAAYRPPRRRNAPLSEPLKKGFRPIAPGRGQGGRVDQPVDLGKAPVWMTVRVRVRMTVVLGARDSGLMAGPTFFHDELRGRDSRSQDLLGMDVVAELVGLCGDFRSTEFISGRQGGLRRRRRCCDGRDGRDGRDGHRCRRWWRRRCGWG